MQPQAPQEQTFAVLTSDGRKLAFTKESLEYFPLLKNIFEDCNEDTNPAEPVKVPFSAQCLIGLHNALDAFIGPSLVRERVQLIDIETMQFAANCTKKNHLIDAEHIGAIDFLGTLESHSAWAAACGLMRTYCAETDCKTMMLNAPVLTSIRTAITTYREKTTKELLENCEILPLVPSCTRRALENDPIVPDATGYACLQVQRTTEGIAHVPGIQEVRSLKIYFRSPAESQQNVLSAGIGNLTNLQELEIERLGGATDQLPSTIGQLCNLTCLKIPHLGLRAVPASLTNLQQLTKLDIHWALAAKYETPAFSRVLPFLTKLQSLKGTGPNGNNACDQQECAAVIQAACQLPLLEKLDLFFEKLHELPSDIQHATRLRELILCYAMSLKRLPAELCLLTQLQKLDCYNCFALQNPPDNLGDMQSLTELTLDSSKVTTLPQNITRLTRLATLKIAFTKYKNLEVLAGMTRLQELYMDDTQAKQLKTHGILPHLVRQHEEREREERQREAEERRLAEQREPGWNPWY